MNNNGKFVTAAFIISTLGLIVLALCTWAGMSLTHVSPVGCVGMALGVFVIGGISIFYGVKAKMASGDFARWRNVEIICIVGMVMTATFAFTPTVRTFNFINNIGTLRAAAHADIDSISGMMEDFRVCESERVNTTFNGFENYVNSGVGQCTPALRQYIYDRFRAQPAEMTHNFVRVARGEAQGKVDNIRLGNEVYGDTFLGNIESLRSTVGGANPVHYAILEATLDECAEVIGGKLTEVSESFSLPLINTFGESVYDVRQTEANRYETVCTRYKEAYSDLGDYTVVGIVAALLAILIYLFDYFISYRALKRAIDIDNKPSDRLGLPL